MQSHIPVFQAAPKRTVETLTHIGFNYVKITLEFASGRRYEHFECNCHREEKEADIKTFMNKVFH